MPGTLHDIKVKNNAFANDVRKGKQAVRPSRREMNGKKFPLSTGAIVIIAFVVIGGVFFEFAHLIFGPN